MKKIILFLLRALILVIVLLPVLFPYLPSNNEEKTGQTVNIYVQNKIPPPNELFKLKSKIKDFFGENAILNFVTYGEESNTPSLDYDDLLSKLDSSNTQDVIVSNSHFFGEDSEKFQLALKNTPSFQEKRLYLIDENALHPEENFKKNFIVLSNLFLPKTIFVNNGTVAIVTLIGKAAPNTKIKISIELSSGDSYLNSKEVEIQTPSSGKIREMIEVPVQFVKTGLQSVIARISSQPSLSSEPTNTAVTTVQVAYSKTTILHVGFSPDWNLRTIRWKLKFWPNLDLLSYYILREITSDQSIRPSELSLIEFPAEKLFGEQLANIHGILAQNFVFGSYLARQETQNLIDYIYGGGRLVYQSGPQSFSYENESIDNLLPCQNSPTLDKENTYHWIANNESVSLANEEKEAFNHIVSSSTFIHCKPKESAIVLARLKENNDPVLLAMPLEKGIVLSILSTDWLTAYSKLFSSDENSHYSQRKEANATDAFFQWIVEFLQRRQDSGLRAPEFTGPRLYADEKFLPIKTTGTLNLKENYVVQTPDQKNIRAKAFLLKNINTSMLELQQTLRNLLPQIENRTLGNQFALTLNPASQSQQIAKFKIFPIFSGTAKKWEKYSNPFLFEGVQTLESSSLQHDQVKRKNILTHSTPWIEKYPWILALALGLLSVEQILTRWDLKIFL